MSGIKPFFGKYPDELSSEMPAREEEQEPSQGMPSAQIQNPEQYIILPSRKHGSYEYPNTFIAKARTLQGKKWHEAQEALHEEGMHMPTIRQYVDFLNLIRSGNALDGNGHPVNKSELDSILDEILTVRSPWRAEWLDAKFSKQGQQGAEPLYITYHKLNSASKLEEVTEPLQECLMQDKLPGIDLEDWLRNANEQGLPSPSTKEGNLWYWHPLDGTVAGFVASSYRAGLDCYWLPQSSDSALGVRACAEGATPKNF